MARKHDRNGDRKRRSAGGVFRRALGLAALLPVAGRIPGYARLVWALALDERTPASHKAVLGAALGYLVLGRDLVADEVPLVGGLDDIVVIALAIDVFLDGVPRWLIDEKLDELDLDRRAFDSDIAQIRRLTPGPLRGLARRLPGAIGAVGEAADGAGIGPRLRRMVNREDSLA